MKRLAAALLIALTSCAPALNAVSTVAIVAQRSGADLVIPNTGAPLLDGWGLVIDGTADYTLDAQGQAWCPEREVLDSPKYGKFVRVHCKMPALATGSQRRLVTASGSVIAAQGFAQRDGSKLPIPITLP